MSLDAGNFDIGERVKIVKPYRDGVYSNGCSVRQIPLGTCGIVTKYSEGRDIRIRINEQDYDFFSDELSYIGKSESDARENDFLEDLLNAKEPVSNETQHSQKGFLGFFQRIKGFLGYEHKQETLESSTKQKPFEPKFNVREEFAVWIRQEFPELKEYAENSGGYNNLIKRKNEVYNAAKLACEHGIETSESCVSDQFVYFLRNLDKCKNWEFNSNIFYLIKYIEEVSASLSEPGNRHYGTEVKN